MENNIQCQDCSDILQYQILITMKHKCKPNFFDVVWKQNVIRETQHMLYVSNLHILLIVLLVEQRMILYKFFIKLHTCNKSMRLLSYTCSVMNSKSIKIIYLQVCMIFIKHNTILGNQ